MNPLNTIKGTIIAGFVLAVVLGIVVNKSISKPGTTAKDAGAVKTIKK